jgi:hypothetical protein
MPISVNLIPIGLQAEACVDFDKASAVLAAQYLLCVGAMGVGFTPPYDCTPLVKLAVAGTPLSDPRYYSSDVIVGICKGFNLYIAAVAAGLMIKPTPVYPPVSIAPVNVGVLQPYIRLQADASIKITKPTANFTAPPVDCITPFYNACATYIYNIYAMP